MLRIAFKVSVWYYRLVTKNLNFAVPVFELPHGGSDELYNSEISSLKQALSDALNEKTESASELAAQKNKLTALNGYISILEGKQEETEDQTQSRIAALEAQLKAKDAELAKKTERERKEYREQINQRATARKLNLSEQETRYLIDRQLREAGWDADSLNLRYGKGTRPQVGRNIAIAEWPTSADENGNTGFADYVLFIGLKPIAVIEAKKQNKDVVDKLNECVTRGAYGLLFY